MVPQTELRVSFQAFGLSSSNTIFARRTSTQSGAVSVLCCCTHLPITICGVHLDSTPDLIAALLAAHSDAVAERLVLCCGTHLPIIICGVHLDPTPDLIAAVLRARAQHYQVQIFFIIILSSNIEPSIPPAYYQATPNRQMVAR